MKGGQQCRATGRASQQKDRSREGQPLGAWTRAALASWGRSVATREDGDGSSVLQPMANRRASYMASGKEMGGGEIMSRHGWDGGTKV